MTDLNTAETLTLDYELPEYPALEPGYRRAPRRESHLTEADKALAIKNALRYIHPDHHEQMAKEFAQELRDELKSAQLTEIISERLRAFPITYADAYFDVIGDELLP